jgi:hypothetical protein
LNSGLFLTLGKLGVNPNSYYSQVFGFTKKLFSSVSSAFDQKLTAEMQLELKAIGGGPGGSELTAGIGMIKIGASELFLGWLDLIRSTRVPDLGQWIIP